jgi:hypothetical protein
VSPKELVNDAYGGAAAAVIGMVGVGCMMGLGGAMGVTGGFMRQTGHSIGGGRFMPLGSSSFKIV